MSSAEVLVDAYGRIQEIVHRAVGGLSPEQLTVQLEPGTNSVAWLVWHLTRVQDDHLSDVEGAEQVWTSGGWMERFGLPFDRHATGYGHGAADVRGGTRRLGGPLGWVPRRGARTDRTVPPAAHRQRPRAGGRHRVDSAVTLGVRLVSVISDNLQHAGQAAFVRGVIERRN